MVIFPVGNLLFRKIDFQGQHKTIPLASQKEIVVGSESLAFSTQICSTLGLHC